MEINEYIEKIQSINKNIDIEKLKKAYVYSKNAHEGQLRKSGEPFFIHPLAVSLIVAELEVDSDTIVACLLHDTIEDTDVDFENIEEEFGHSVAQLVDGVTKLTKMHYETKKEIQVENLRKMFLAMAKDIRVILIKLVDRLHNMRTLKYQSEAKKQEKALETLEIYVPIAHRLGIFKIKGELEDLCLLYLEPEIYYDLSSKMNKKLSERKSYIDSVISQISESLDETHMSYEIYGRPKNFYSIYKKLKYQNKEFSEIYDITAIRILVDSVKDCYAALGVVHTMWKPMPGRFKDYIAMPKPNMYRSLHTTVMGNEGEPFEVQIRTHEMHRVSEYGIAAHFSYKEKKGMSNIDEKLVWLRQMMEWQGDIDNPEEFMDSLKIDILNHQVYVFTPQSSVVELPDGSTPVDFAYKIHTEVGNKCVGAKVNGRIVPLSFKLSTGEIVEIMTQKNSNGPSRDWLTFVKSTQAKNKIKHWFKKERREENIEKGRDMLEKEIKKAGFKPNELMQNKWLDPLMARLSVYSLDDLYATIGYGGIMMNQVLPKLKEAFRKEHQVQEPEDIKTIEIKKEETKEQERNRKRAGQSIIVKGLDDVLTRFAKCCTPVPGDDIIGYITRGRGVTIHRADCKNFENTDEMKNRFIEVAWQVEETATFTTEIQVIAPDRKGLLSEVTSIITAINLVVTGVSAKLLKSGVAVINLSIEVTDINKLNSLLSKLKTLEDIIEVKRVTS